MALDRPDSPEANQMRPEAILARLTLAFGSLAVILVTVGWLAVIQMQQTVSRLRNIADERIAKVDLAREALGYSNLNYQLTLQVFMEKDANVVGALLVKRKDYSARTTNLIGAISNQLGSPQERDLLQQVIAERNPYRESYTEALRLLLQDKDFEQARTVMLRQTLPALRKYHGAWQAFAAFEGREMNRAIRENEAIQTQSTVVTSSLILLAVGLAVAIAVVVRRSMIVALADQRRGEKELRKQRAYLTAVVSHSPIAIVTLDRQSHIEMCNQAFERLFLYRQEEIAGRVLHEVLAPLEEAEQARGNSLATLSGESIHRIGRRMRKDGTMADVEIFAGPLIVGQRIIGICVLFHDLSERLRAEQAVRESEERRRMLAHTLQSAGECISITDTEDHILYVNDAFLKTYGYREDELIGQHISVVSSARTSAETRAAILPGTLAGEWHGELWNRTKDGREFPISLNTSTVRDEAGRRIALVGIARDITERKLYEQELLRAKDAAEAASRAKGEFLANMSHEIRTPMNGIIGMTELTLATGLTVEQRLYLEMVKKSSDGLMSVINDILDFSKIEAGKLELSPIEFNLRECVSDAVTALGLRAEEKGLELTCEISAALPEVLLGDPNRVRQILVNLVGNAVKFTEQGEVRVQVELESQSAQQMVVEVCVTDTGIGIALDKQEAIFHAFSQADNSTTRRYGGTGLGLTICARLVELMNGSIRVTSRPGAGSAFHFTACFAPAANRMPDVLPDLDDPRVPEMQGRCHILLAEDNAVNALLATRLLENMGHVVCHAANGKQALAALQAQPFDLVMMDVQMPVMDGLEATDAIRQAEKATGRHIPIIALTAHAMKGDREHCLAAGMDGYLTKPIRSRQLREAISGFISRSAVAQDPTGICMGRAD